MAQCAGSKLCITEPTQLMWLRVQAAAGQPLPPSGKPRVFSGDTNLLVCTWHAGRVTIEDFFALIGDAGKTGLSAQLAAGGMGVVDWDTAELYYTAA